MIGVNKDRGKCERRLTGIVVNVIGVNKDSGKYERG
jgi:hypothetical protein